VVGSKLFVFGGHIGALNHFNDMWSLDLNSPQPLGELYEPIHGNKKPLPRFNHASVTTEDRIIIFGGYGGRYLNDIWSFDIWTRKWTELKCTGPIPSPRAGHGTILVDDVMYVFGGYMGTTYLCDLTALQLSTQRWFKFQNEGSSPLTRAYPVMVSDGTRVFVLGGSAPGRRSDELSNIYVFDTKDIKFPDPEPNVNPNVKTTQLVQKSSASPPTPEQPQLTASSSETHDASPTRLELERQVSELLAAQTERDQRIARLTDEFAALKSEHAGARRLMLMKLIQKDAELVDTQSKLLSRDEEIGQYKKELTNVRAKLEANESKLEAVRLRLTDAEKGLTKSKAEADTLRA